MTWTHADYPDVLRIPRTSVVAKKHCIPLCIPGHLFTKV